MYSLKNKRSGQKYFLNSNKTILYFYDENEKIIERIFRDKWCTIDFNVIKEGNQVVENLQTIIDNDNDFIKQVQVISSTLEPSGDFVKTHKKREGITHFLNEFLGSKNFIESKKENKYKKSNLSTIELLEKETPTINLLIRNLFNKEKDEVIINFLNWLNVVGFEDRCQDIVFCFFGTTQELQGQGAGKGVLVEFLKKMFSGLVCTISNQNYLSNFNGNLMNKKIVLFEEVDFKTLNFTHLKFLTGSPNITIENKGRDSIVTDNVASWLMFSNDHDLYDKITIDDRRTFLIRPTPENGSLLRKVKEHYGDFKSFENKLYSEMENFIHIVSSLNGKVLTPNELTTQGHIDYFKSKSKISITEILSLYKVLTNKEFKKKLYEVLDTIKTFNRSLNNDIEECKQIIDLGVINYKTFNRVFSYLQQYDYIPKNKKLNVEWELSKELLESNGFTIIKIDCKQSKKFERFRENIISKEDNYKLNRLKILNKLKKVFGSFL